MPTIPWSYITEALGGLALFILGMRTLSEGLQKATGERLRRLLERGTANRLTAPLLGSCLASLLQSGSAASILVVGFVNAGLLSLYQALGVLLGTSIGTSIAIQFIAFRVSTLALPAITLGVALSFFSRSRRLTYIGRLLLGAGLVFFGLAMMEGACLPLRESALFTEVRRNLLSVRFFAVLSGALITFVTQSGSAALGLVIALASGGAISYEAAIAMVLGEVAGASVIPIIASLGGSSTAKRTVILYFVINSIAIALALVFFPLFVRAVRLVSPGDALELKIPSESLDLLSFTLRPYVARHLANAHTIFSLATAVLFLPLIGFFARSADAFLPTRRSDHEARPRFIDNRVIKTPTIALAQAWNELGRMVQIAATTYRELVSQFHDFDPKLAANLKEKEVVLDVLHRDISHFLIAVSREPLGPERAVEIPTMLQLVNDVELIGDECEDLIDYLLRKKEERLHFSGSAMGELIEFANKAGDALFLAERVLLEDSLESHTELKMELAALEEALQKSHMQRLKAGRCTVVAGLLYGDMIAAFSKIAQLSFSLINQKRGLTDVSSHSRD
ncbi:Na/Pi cotransporter family protein [Geomonas sp. RF6]|uniref:Na/Pi cotransporter family protein n=1 Tax=Geomonas sp. RF6 TaxID=2897342 RepID=UPI001E63BEA4|nr:Na/Pi cotransporter family protein [Geomonas sp. RF6]UFS70043.1 Na/Pi cotransporter family protein [Geomonas sp. RF6]